MVNTRGLMVLIVALAMGALAARGAKFWVDKKVKEELQVITGKVKANQEVLVALRDIPRSAPITAEDVKIVLFPDEAVPPTAVRDPEEAIGRITRVPLYEGEPILEPKLAVAGSQGGLSAVIPLGSRAMTIKVNDISGIAGFILPGSKVDVVAVLKQDRGRPPVSKMVLQNIDVLAIDQIIDMVENKPTPVGAVTLLVTPAEAEKLALSSEEGEIRLAMRSFGDDALTSTPGVDARSLMSRPSRGVAPRRSSIEVIERDRKFSTSVNNAPGRRRGEVIPVR